MSDDLIRVGRALSEPAPEVLEPAAELLVVLERSSRARRADLLAQRREVSRKVREGGELAVDPASAQIRSDDSWQVAAPPAELAVRQVELATPATADQARAALSSGADVWVADLEDSLVPSWDRLVGAHRVIATTVAQHVPARPVLMMRPRGLHLEEAHLEVDGAPVSAAVADVGIFLGGQAAALIEAGSAPYLYLPKVESAQEAAWWDALFATAEAHLGLPTGAIRVSVLVETVTAAYQLEEILYAMRGRITGLAAGRWDYVFSYLRTYGTRPDHVLPDLESFTMNTKFLRTYTDLIVQACHRRGAQAIGGPVALVPGGPFDDATLQAQARLARDKTREARAGFDGAWVRHPAQVAVARAPFAAVAEAREPGAAGAADRPRGLATTTPARIDGAALADVSGIPGSATLTGLRSNLRAALTYLTGWLDGEGACVLDGHLQDISTVELSRLQVWQWLHHGVRVAEGPEVTPLLLSRMITDEVAVLRRRVGEGSRLDVAEKLLTEAILAQEPPAFIAIHAYRALLTLESEAIDSPDAA